MRKRLSLIWTLIILGAALSLPATTAAASGYTYKVLYNYCDGNEVNLRMRNSAAGWTPANRLTIEAWAQRKLATGWQTVYTFDTKAHNFQPNGAKHSLTVWWSYIGNNYYYFRLVFRLRVWDDSDLLVSTTYRSVKC